MSKNSIYKKRVLSEIADISVALIAATIIYYFTAWKNDYEYMNIIFFLSIIYFINGVFCTFLTNGQSIGDTLFKISLVNVKNGINSKLKFFMHYLAKSIAIFMITDLDILDLFGIIIVILFIVPIKIQVKEQNYYSMLNLGFKSTYINVK